jgi:hypothetical protein
MRVELQFKAYSGLIAETFFTNYTRRREHTKYQIRKGGNA